MRRVGSMISVMAVLMGAALVADGRDLQTAVPATPENVKPFLGDWTIAATGSYGEARLAMSLKVAEGKVAGEVTDANGTHAIIDAWKSGTSLVCRYAFDYQGMRIDAVVTLTPGDKKVDAALDFANGSAQFVGTAALAQAAGTTQAASGTGVAGLWKGTMDTQMGAVETTITIDAGSALAGKVKVADYEGKIDKGTLNGDKIAFQITIEPGTIAYVGSVSGDEMKLLVTGTTGNQMNLIAKRQK